MNDFRDYDIPGSVYLSHTRLYLRGDTTVIQVRQMKHLRMPIRTGYLPSVSWLGISWSYGDHSGCPNCPGCSNKWWLGHPDSRRCQVLERKSKGPSCSQAVLLRQSNHQVVLDTVDTRHDVICFLLVLKGM